VAATAAAAAAPPFYGLEEYTELFSYMFYWSEYILIFRGIYFILVACCIFR